MGARAVRDDAVGRILLPGFFVALAVAVRALPWPTVLTRALGVYPFDNDAYYHLRRIWYSVVNFPELLARDPYINFPSGGQVIWTPIFDWLLALLVRFTLGSDDPAAMERLLVWVPPLLGGATAAALYFLARRYFPQSVAVLAALILCVLPAHFWNSQIGFVDHHVAVALVATGVLAAAMALFCEPLTQRRPAGRGLRRSATVGVALGGALLVWPGCLIHVGIVEAALLARLLALSRREPAVAWARLCALANAVAGVVVLPLSLGNAWELWGAFSPVVLSNFQPLWFGSAALCFAVLSAWWNRVGFPSSMVDRILAAAFVGLAALGVALGALPPLAEGLVDSLRWLGRAETFQAQVGESTPLFHLGRRFPEAFLSRAFYALPLVAAALVWSARRSASRPALGLLVWWTLALGVATLMQHRFKNCLSVSYALLLAWALHALYARLDRRLGARIRWRAGAAAAAAAVAVFLFWPVIAMHAFYVANLQRVARGEEPQLHYELRVQFILVSVARWLRQNSPATAGFLDERQEPEYAVLAPWSAGHVLKYVAQRPVVQDNFGSHVGEGFARAQRYYAAHSEEEALAALDGIDVRYVLVNSAEPDVGDLLSMRTRLDTARGSAQWVAHQGSEDERRFVPALVRHRLILESEPLVGEPGVARPVFEVYEIVPGAEVVGRALPGSQVLARLPIRPVQGKEFEFRTGARADADGRYALRLPYPSEPFSPAVRVGDRYQLSSRGVSAPLEVSGASVREGARVRGPDLRPEQGHGKALSGGDDSREPSRPAGGR